jgi:hypothetical protein
MSWTVPDTLEMVVPRKDHERNQSYSFLEIATVIDGIVTKSLDDSQDHPQPVSSWHGILGGQVDKVTVLEWSAERPKRYGCR